MFLKNSKPVEELAKARSGAKNVPSLGWAAYYIKLSLAVD